MLTEQEKEDIKKMKIEMFKKSKNAILKAINGEITENYNTDVRHVLKGIFTSAENSYIRIDEHEYH